MTDIYLHFICTHYGLYGNAPVPASERQEKDDEEEEEDDDDHNIEEKELEKRCNVLITRDGLDLAAAT